MDKKHLTAGVSYYPDHWPKEDWERDMKLIKASGIDMIRFGEFSWYWYEPEEGRFTFDNYDHFMNLAHQLDLQVVLCTPTAAPPAWMLHRYPDIRHIDQNGHYHMGGRHMVNYNHPKAKELAEKAILALAERYRDHPALAAWQIDNEPTYGESVTKANIYDYSEYTTALFRDYLKEKYGSLDKLNKEWVNNFWSRSYSAWEEIKAPVSSVIPSLWLEWLRFRDQNLTDFVNWQVHLLRSVRKDFFIGTNIPECGPVASVYLGQDYWRQAENLDYAGTDIYCFKRNEYKEKNSIGYICDIIGSAARASGAELWISEAQGGPHLAPWRVDFFWGYWEPEFIKRYTKEFALHGAEKIIYFMWRPVRGGAEFGLHGMVLADGSPTGRSEVVREAFEEAETAINEMEQKPVVYLHYSRDSLLLCSGFDPDGIPDTSIRGWYDLMSDMGYRIEFLDDEGLIRKEWHSSDWCVFPLTFLLTDRVAEAIAGMARKGVQMVMGYGTGFYNEYGACGLRIPDKGLDQLFGYRVTGADSMPYDIAPSLEGAPALKVDVMTSVFGFDKGEITLRDSMGRAMMLLNGNIRYAAFDAGSMYRNKTPEYKEAMLKLMAAQLQK